MAEELTVIEETDAVGIEAEEETTEVEKKPRFSKKQLIIFGASGFLFLLIVIILIVVLSSSNKEEDYAYSDDVDQSLQKRKPIPVSDLEKLIKKANILYAKGNRDEALALFKKIAIQSESLSFYNLGVARMKNEQYKEALQAFQKAILDNQNITISAINAAVCSLHLNDKANHTYYINLAKSSLSDESTSPLYAYLKSLIEYYQDRPFETIATLKHPTSDFYKDEKNYLRAKSFYAVNDPAQSIAYLEKMPDDEDLSGLGMMYARIGNLHLAEINLKKAMESGLNLVRNTLALAHVLLKEGHMKEASTLYKQLYQGKKQSYLTMFPIKVFLKKSQFDIKAVQQQYKEEKSYTDSINFKILFHYAPYKIFDATQTVGIIKKGSANIFIEDINSASAYLKKGSRFSKVNKVIASAIKNSLHLQLDVALKQLQKAVKKYPNHSVLNYNLALTYAKLGDLSHANSYFIRSYHQDAKNYLAGIFAIMTGKLINNEPLKLKEIFKENLATEIDTQEIELVKAITAFYEHNYPSILSWKEDIQKPSTLSDILLLLTYRKLGLTPNIKQTATHLVKSSPKDVLSHILYIHSMYKDLPNKDFALKTLGYIAQQHFSLDSIFYGSEITEELFINFTLVTGHLYDLRTKLKKQQEVATRNVIPITKALARTNLYLTKFEEAYVLYNQIIDEYKQKDSNTLFQAALAAIEAGHHANAIALLELSNLRNKYNSESRYALGLLYLESKNYNAASIQFSKILEEDFQSSHFNFMVDSINIGKKLAVVK